MLGRANRLAMTAGLGLIFALAITGAGRAQTADPSGIEQLQEVINAQQRQLKAQQRQLEEQKRHLEQMQGQINSLLKTVRGTPAGIASTADTPAVSTATPTGADDAGTGPAPDPVADGWPSPEPLAADAQGSDVIVSHDDLAGDLAPVSSFASDSTVKATNPRVKVTLSGQINRAVNVVDDGQDTDAFFVDNDVTNSRFRLVAEGRFSQAALVGSLIEVAVSPNNSENVSQENQDAGDLIDLRRVEIYFDHQDYGRIWLGKGSTSSDNTAEVDLSGTDVVMYSSVADIVGGILFREKSSGELSDVAVKDAFFNFDGLGRKDRLRYDTPEFHGFQLSASAISDARYDGAVLWAGQAYGLSVASAFAVSDPNSDNVDYRLDGSTSILHDETGLNLTLSGGMDQVDGGDNRSNLYAKAGWLADKFDFGTTAFGIDVTRGENLAADGDQGYSVGGAVVQRIDPFGTELFAQVRWFTLDPGRGPAFDDIVAGTLGARVQF